MEPVIVYS